jgi:hypothetical protein
MTWHAADGRPRRRDQTIRYTRRGITLTVTGRGFDSPRLHSAPMRTSAHHRECSPHYPAPSSRSCAQARVRAAPLFASLCCCRAPHFALPHPFHRWPPWRTVRRDAVGVLATAHRNAVPDPEAHSVLPVVLRPFDLARSPQGLQVSSQGLTLAAARIASTLRRLAPAPLIMTRYSSPSAIASDHSRISVMRRGQMRSHCGVKHRLDWSCSERLGIKNKRLTAGGTIGTFCASRPQRNMRWPCPVNPANPAGRAAGPGVLCFRPAGLWGSRQKAELQEGQELWGLFGRRL